MQDIEGVVNKHMDISNQGKNQESRVVELQQGHKAHATLI